MVGVGQVGVRRARGRRRAPRGCAGRTYRGMCMTRSSGPQADGVHAALEGRRAGPSSAWGASPGRPRHRRGSGRRHARSVSRAVPIAGHPERPGGGPRGQVDVRPWCAAGPAVHEAVGARLQRRIPGADDGARQRSGPRGAAPARPSIGSMHGERRRGDLAVEALLGRVRAPRGQPQHAAVRAVASHPVRTSMRSSWSTVNQLPTWVVSCSVDGRAVDHDQEPVPGTADGRRRRSRRPARRRAPRSGGRPPRWRRPSWAGPPSGPRAAMTWRRSSVGRARPVMRDWLGLLRGASSGSAGGVVL